MAALVVEEFRADETGVYRCRVDFRTAQTRNTFFNVSLIGEAASYNKFNLNKFSEISSETGNLEIR